MHFAVRGALAAAALSACVLVAGCGGSVADADYRSATAPAQPTQAPAATAFCAASRASSEAIDPLNALISRGEVDQAALARAADAVRRAESDMLAAAPSDVRADVQTTVDAVDAQLDSLITHGGDSRAVSADPALTARLGSPEVTAANTRLTAYLTRTCTTSNPTNG
jgi:alpha-beta hydrolase superfamily lysophospholipase